MKKISLLLLAGTIVFASCQKQNDQIFSQTEQTNTDKVQTSSWTNVAFSSEAGKSTAASGQIIVPAIDSAVLSGGVVLVYSKDNNTINTLPATTSDVEWSYEIKNSSIVLSASAEKGLPSLTGLQFSYVIVPAEKLATYEEKGITADDLINMSYASATGVFAGNAVGSR